jgi:YidC/Oxa1 family membrane protein insertase
MERRVLLAFLLSLLVLLVYQSLVVPPPAPEPGAAATGTGAPTDAVPVDVTDPPRPAPVVATAAEAEAAAERGADTDITPLVADDEPRDIVVESERVRAVFRNRGASPVSWQLKEHLDQETGQSIDLVPPELPPGELPPFSLVFDDPELTARAADALFRPSAAGVSLSGRAETLGFEFTDSSGFRVSKTYEFEPATGGYLVRFRASAFLGDLRLSPAIGWGPALGGVESSSTGMVYREGPRGVIFGRLLDAAGLEEEGITRPTASDVVARPSYRGQIGFAGVDNHYFVAVALIGRQESEVTYRYVPLPPLLPDGPSRELMAFSLEAPGDSIDLPFFIGPKEFDTLERVDAALVRSIDFGWLSWLVVPLHRSLTWIHGYVANWGWAIIILTVLVNIIIFPLRHKSVVSMRKMAEVQPEMKAIQERYAHLKTTDPEKQKMNQEIMALYRERGVNPASGCLPMLLTFPILFAFFSLLRSAVEIRGEPFVGWITDLSVEDPLYITPIVMGASMVLQQKMTPTQADPMQQKIMMLMPVVFTFMFVWAPSGLVIYWLTSNVIGILQTVVTNRVIGPPKTRTVRPPAERRVNAPVERRTKKSGKGGGPGRKAKAQ